jgi:ribosomal-protein-alanine N-acetyltransferase
VNTSAPVITTARLVLRDFQEDDAEKIVEYFSEREAQPYILTPQRSGNGMAAFVKVFAEQARASPWTARSHFAWAIALRDTSEVIGTCNLYHATADSDWTNVGWHLSGRFSGRGYATEAGRELMRFAFEERGVARVLADCFESNSANRRVFSKLGMRPVSALPLRKWWLAFTYGESEPIVRYMITRQLFGENALVA